MKHSPEALSEAIRSGATALGIELGSTRIKACLVLRDDPSTVLAVGSHEWENQFVDRVWTYSLDHIWSGLQATYADLVSDVEQRHSTRPQSFGTLGISAMMHGYLAFDAHDELLVPFRTWRNTSTGDAAEELTKLFGENVPQRWSIAHLRQAALNNEEHVAELAFMTTLAGYVHWKLSGRTVLGVGDASGMFPIDPHTGGYNERMLEQVDSLLVGTLPPVVSLLPSVLSAGSSAGELSPAGAALLDPTGFLHAGIPMCPPEGDAGTGMVATNAVAPRTGNVSAGTSIFAMMVMERPLTELHRELDLVTTPAGDPVAMVHCNNGASELGEWIGLFRQFAAATGIEIDSDTVYATLFQEALAGEPDAGGLLAYNYLAGEHIVGLAEGRPLFVRTPDSRFTLANVMRAQLYGVFGTLALGMQILTAEGVEVDRMFAHGGLFRTAGVAQRFLATALGAPVAVGVTASEGGAWGIAVLAAYHATGSALPLGEYLDREVFAQVDLDIVEPDAADRAGFLNYLVAYRAGIAIEAAAVSAL